MHQVLVVPGRGHSDDEGLFDLGRCIGRYSELDVIDGYVSSLVDELENDGIRYQVLPTRQRPGIRAGERFLHVEQFTLVLHLCAGWAEGDAPAKNASSVFFGGGTGGARDLAEALSDAMGDWGQCYVFGHRTTKPGRLKTDTLLGVPDTIAARVEPFALNGADVEEYMRRLPALGEALGRAVSGFLMSRGQARARQAIGLG